MIISKVRRVREANETLGWNELRYFQNVTLVTDQIMDLHAVGAAQRANVRKQAEQIRNCLMQAREYFAAAKTVSSATKPVLQYYGMMSLALAELLLKQDGGSSLDVARGQNKHHGLTFSVAGKPSLVTKLSESGHALRAQPLIKGDGTRVGTFDLWHTSAREAPISGMLTEELKGGNHSRAEVMATGTDTRFPLMQPAGLSLLDCFKGVPHMRDTLGTAGVETLVVRGVITERRYLDGRVGIILVVHPSSGNSADEILKRHSCPTAIQQHLQISRPGGGLVITMMLPAGVSSSGTEYPQAFQSRIDELHFSLADPSLNEFGFLYVGAYILGNYARYYPDMWMADVERCSPLAVASEVFMNHLETRAPVIAASEMTRRWYLHG